MNVKIKKYMVFEDKDGSMGVILKNNTSPDATQTWWKCYRGEGGQIFKQSEGYIGYDDIAKLYECRLDKFKIYCAFKFMFDGNLDNYKEVTYES